MQNDIVAYPHQKQGVLAAADKPGFGFFLEMGLGKTKMFLDNLLTLWRMDKVDSALIIAPKGAYMNWIHNEIPKHGQNSFSTRAWSADLTKKQEEALECWCSTNLGSIAIKVLVMNVEAVATMRGYAMAELFLKSNRPMMCVDESTSIKSPKAQRTKAILKLGMLAPYRRIMSGTPITQSPLDVYTQMKFLDPKILGFSSYYTFRNQYARMVTINLGPRSFQKVDGYKNLDELQAKLQTASFRCLKKDCLTLPDKIYTTRYVEPSDAQRKAYNSLKEKAVLEFDAGIVTVPHALTLMMRMHQVLCGHTKLDNGTEVDIDPPADNPRLKVLLEVIEEAGTAKVIVWCNYQRDVVNICGVLAEIYGTESVVHYYGRTGDEDRAESLKRFQEDPKCRFFVGTQATGGVGITLVAASTVVYYSQSYNLLYRLQSEDRAHRIGQERNVTYVDLVVKKSVDERIAEALRGKHDMAKLVLGDIINSVLTG